MLMVFQKNYRIWLLIFLGHLNLYLIPTCTIHKLLFTRNIYGYTWEKQGFVPMILCMFFFLFTVMKIEVVFFHTRHFLSLPLNLSLFFSNNPWSPGKYTEVLFISNINTTDPIFCVKEMSKSIFPAWFNQFPFEKENLWFFYLQPICQYFYSDI